MKFSLNCANPTDIVFFAVIRSVNIKKVDSLFIVVPPAFVVLCLVLALLYSI